MEKTSINLELRKKYEKILQRKSFHVIINT